MKLVRMLIVDDHKIIRDGLKLILAREKEIEIIAEADNGVEAIKYLEKNAAEIDVVLIDINMPEMNGIEATKIITKNYKHINVLALTMHIEEPYVLKMIRAGALGYILKDAGAKKLVEAVKIIGEGEKYYSKEASIAMINSIVTGKLNDNKDSK